MMCLCGADRGAASYPTMTSPNCDHARHSHDSSAEEHSRRLNDRFSVSGDGHNLNIPLYAVFFLLLLSCACNREDSPSASVAENTVPASPTTLSANRAELPPCPPGDLPSLPEGSPHTGDHRVTLTWNASVPRPNVNDEDIGYCLYRSKDHPVQKEKRKTAKVAKKHPCQECEGVNTFPIRQTSCIDNVVKDDVLYYYVAIATNKNGLSEFSNQARAKIPAKAAGMPLPSGSYRLCRARDDTP